MLYKIYTIILWPNIDYAHIKSHIFTPGDLFIDQNGKNLGGRIEMS